MPPKPDLSYIGLEEFTSEPAIKTLNAKINEDVLKVVPNDNGAPIIKDRKSDDEDECVPQPKIEKKTIKPSVAKNTHPYPKRNIVPREVLMKSGIKSVNAARQFFSKAAVTINTARPVNTAHSRTTINAAKPRPKAVLNAVKGNEVYAVKALAYLKKLMEDMLPLEVTPKEGKTLAKVTSDESRLWHKRLGHLNFKTMNKLVKGNHDETSGIFKSFITRIKNLVDHKVKVIRCDNGTEFKNMDMNQFFEMKGIMRQYSVARTPQQNGFTERRNRTLIAVAMTMLADSKLPTTFWAEAVNTACYVQK
nr:ribonuclease H-like domain-containing protein [Tanacetum cinerariifolium]